MDYQNTNLDWVSSSASRNINRESSLGQGGGGLDGGTEGHHSEKDKEARGLE